VVDGVLKSMSKSQAQLITAEQRGNQQLPKGEFGETNELNDRVFDRVI
jgi:hypothetical protein